MDVLCTPIDHFFLRVRAPPRSAMGYCSIRGDPLDDPGVYDLMKDVRPSAGRAFFYLCVLLSCDVVFALSENDGGLPAGV